MEMMMKKILLSMLLGSSVLSLNAAKADEPKMRPNIILILADDLGFSEVGFNGQKKIRTPHLDAMAEAGALMTNFFAARGASIVESTHWPERGTVSVEY